MSASQKTNHYELPIYAGSDITGWLSGFNPAMQAIDTALFNINQTAEDANGTAVGAEADAQTAITSAQNTANLLTETNVKVNTLVNKLTFNSITFDRPHSGAILVGETNTDNSISIIRASLSDESGLPSDYTVNGTNFHEFGNCDGKLVNNVLSGSASAGFTGTAKPIGYIPILTGGNNRVVGMQAFYDNSAKKTRFGILTNNTVQINESHTSCMNTVITNTQYL